MKVSELLASPAQWTKGEWARDANGAPVHPLSVMADSWCLSGAVCKCYYEDGNWDEYQSALWRLECTSTIALSRIPEPFTGFILLPSLIRFNDESTHEQVLALCREAGV